MSTYSEIFGHTQIGFEHTGFIKEHDSPWNLLYIVRVELF